MRGSEGLEQEGEEKGEGDRGSRVFFSLFVSSVLPSTQKDLVDDTRSVTRSEKTNKSKLLPVSLYDTLQYPTLLPSQEGHRGISRHRPTKGRLSKP